MKKVFAYSGLMAIINVIYCSILVKAHNIPADLTSMTDPQNEFYKLIKASEFLKQCYGVLTLVFGLVLYFYLNMKHRLTIKELAKYLLISMVFPVISTIPFLFINKTGYYNFILLSIIYSTIEFIVILSICALHNKSMDKIANFKFNRKVDYKL